MKFSPLSSLALLAMLGGGGIVTAQPALAQVSIGIGISVPIAPPILPVYVQPPLPGPDYIWAPGYWAWATDVGDYYWVPGTWVLAPQPGYLWTPGYWGWGAGAYFFHPGYWGTHIGFYGGINYGHGYTGSGYQGGYWQGPHFRYNSSVNNVSNVHITNVYNKTVIINRTTINNVSYNGGNGGIEARPNAEDLVAEHDHHIDATPLQTQHIAAARGNHALFFKANHGAPGIAATARPGDFKGNVVRATNAPHGPEHAPDNAAHMPQPRPAGENNNFSHPEAGGMNAHPQAMKPAPLHHEENAQPHPAMQPHPESYPVSHPESHPVSHPAPHPESHPAYHPESHPVSHAQAPRPQPQPHPHPQPHPQAPRPAQHEEKHNPS